MPKVTEAHLEARTKQIVDAAAVCFSRKGFHQTTMADICEQADLSPGAVYRYFTSKEEIIAAMVGERRQEGVALIEAVKRERHETLAVLDELAELFFSRLGDAQGCALDIELWAEAQANARVRQAMRLDADEIRDSFTEIIRHAQGHGEINPDLDAEAVAQVMCSFFYGLILQKSLDPDVAVWPYVDAIKAMMGGTFWLGANAQKGEQNAELHN